MEYEVKTELETAYISTILTYTRDPQDNFDKLLEVYNSYDGIDGKLRAELITQLESLNYNVIKYNLKTKYLMAVTSTPIGTETPNTSTRFFVVKVDIPVEDIKDLTVDQYNRIKSILDNSIEELFRNSVIKVILTPYYLYTKILECEENKQSTKESSDKFANRILKELITTAISNADKDGE